MSPGGIIGVKSTRLALIVLLVPMLLGMPPALAGSVPNFSGTWQIDKSRSEVHSERSFASLVTQGQLSMVIDHRDPQLRIEQHASLLVTERTVVAVHFTDGRESSNRGARGEAITSKSHWDNGALVTDLRIVRVQGGRSQVISRRDVMSLSEDGKSLSIETTRREPGQDKPDVVRLVFQKQ